MSYKTSSIKWKINQQYMNSITKTNTIKELDLRQLAMVEALEKHLGIVTTACRTVDIARTTHYEWLKKTRHTESCATTSTT